MPVEREIIFETLSAKFPDAKMELQDLAGDNDHWQLIISDKFFDSLSRIEKHRAVMEVLKPLNIHAVTIKFD